jgi:hypothetical protein
MKKIVLAVCAKTSDSGPVYSLDGRKVLTDATGHDKLPNGIYIVNGEKRIIK